MKDIIIVGEKLQKTMVTILNACYDIRGRDKYTPTILEDIPTVRRFA